MLGIPTKAQMSPASTSSQGTRWKLAYVKTSAAFPVLASAPGFTTAYSPLFMVPAPTLPIAMRPLCGSKSMEVTSTWVGPSTTTLGGGTSRKMDSKSGPRSSLSSSGSIPATPLIPEQYTTGKSHRSSGAPRSQKSSKVWSMT